MLCYVTKNSAYVTPWPRFSRALTSNAVFTTPLAEIVVDVVVHIYPPVKGTICTLFIAMATT